MSNLSGPIQGCWTCRLRRKKCSGEQPTCSRCKQLNVTCYGYGSKPSWMDGSIREKEAVDEIRKGVKLTTDGQRRQRALRGLQKQKALNDYSKDSQKGEPDPATITAAFPRLAVTRSSLSNEEDLVLPWSHNSQLESFLLMEYLDFVFPVQFPFYNPKQSQGGRGWLLCLLMQAKPLYNAALSLAAYHHKITSPCTRFDTTLRKMCDEPDLFYHLALRGLRQHIGDLSRKELREGLQDSIEILACVIQLIMFEVARGGYKNWQLHLKAAPDILPFLETYCTPPPSPISSPNALENTTDPRPALSFVDHAAMEFFSGVIIYLDILASASTGLRPQYQYICSEALGRDSKLQLQNFMGCENWVMVLIREIAVLYDWKRQMVEKGVFSVRDLVKKATSIEERLETGLEQLIHELSQPSEDFQKFRSSPYDNILVVRNITHAYTNAAKVYLSVLLSGPNPDLPETIESVSLTLTALVALPDPELLRNVVWPFCIAGCMAKNAHRQAFRDLASAGGIQKHIFGSSWRALEVMEMCWKLTDEGSSCDWFDAMKALGYHVLLV